MITVFTNGCFDLLHVGHVRLLEYARSLGDRLVVGLNGDASVARLKPGRPVLSFRERRELLCAVRWVDEVIGFDADTPEELIERVRPDILVKGTDWSGRRVAGSDLVLARGGRIVFFPVQAGWSTTDLVKRIMRAGESKNGHADALDRSRNA